MIKNLHKDARSYHTGLKKLVNKEIFFLLPAVALLDPNQHTEALHC